MGRGNTGRGAKWHRRINVPMWTALVTSLICALVYLAHESSAVPIPGLDDWERSTVDLRFRLRGEQAPSDDRIVIVALDDDTRKKHPEVWQSRRGYARLVDKLTESAPLAVGIDAFFTSPEINLSSSSIQLVRAASEELARIADPSPATTQALEALQQVDEETRGDEALARSFEASPMTTIATLFSLGGEPRPSGSPEPAYLEKARVGDSAFVPQAPGHRAMSASYALSPLPVIGDAVAHLAHVNIRKEDDGSIHEVPLVIELAGRHYESMALHLASVAMGAPSSYVSGERQVGLGATSLPVSQRAHAFLSYLGPARSFPHLSANELLDHQGPHPALKDKLVLVGYTDAARDKLVTPFDENLDGVELHATLLHNILHGELLRRSGPWRGALTILILGLLVGLLQLRPLRQRGPWWLISGSALLLGAHLVLSHWLFSRHGLVVEMLAPAASIVIVALAAVSASLVTEGREKAELRSAFGQYLQRSMVERILQDPERLRLGGQRRELSVLFSDIRSFSRFSEELEPEDLSDFLNEYLTPMTELVLDDEGTLDKYIGDAVMAFYGAPIDLEDHASRACKTALAMLERLEPLNEAWRQRKLPEVRIGIGINTGDMSVGNMGSESRFDYTVMGDSVNLAARLEGLTKAYGVSVLVGEKTAKAAAADFDFREVDSVRVIGRQAATQIYELLGPAGADHGLDSEGRTLYADALAAYRAADWGAARDELETLLARHPEDGPGLVLRDRVEELAKSPPGPDWDGVYAQSSK